MAALSLCDFVVSKATHLRCSPGTALSALAPVQLGGSQVWSLLSPALSAASPGQWGAYWSHWLSDCIVHTLHAYREGNEERQIVLSKTFISSHPKWLLFIFFIHDEWFFTLIMSVSIFPKCPALYPCALCTLTPLHQSRGATPLHSPLSQTPSLTRTSSWSLCSKYRAGESLWDHIAESSINSFTSKL